MTNIFIEASASVDTAPCHSLDDWERLLAAMERGDSEAVVAITTSVTPKMVPVAQLQEVESPSMADAAAAYWQKRGKAPKARYDGPDETPIVASVRT